MDKKWIYIIIIFIIGISALYLIVDASTVLGSGNVNLNTYTVTLPDGFNIENNENGELSIINRNSGEKIIITDFGKISLNNPEIKKIESELIEEINKNENTTVYDEINLTIANKTVPCIYYETSPGDKVNHDIFITKYNHTFIIEGMNFKDNETFKENVNFIIDNLKPDPKQKQD